MEPVGVVSQHIVQAGYRDVEVRAVDDVVGFSVELDVDSLRYQEMLGQRQVELAEAEGVEGVAAEVAEGARTGRGEGGRVQDDRLVCDFNEGVGAGDYVGTTDVAG